MKYIKKFESSIDDIIYVYDMFPVVVGKFIFKNGVIASKHIYGFYMNDKYSYLNYEGIKRIPIYHDEWLRPANNEEIKFYKELYEMLSQSKKYNL